MVSDPEDRPTIDELLDRAVHAMSDGDRAGAAELARRVLAVDHDNPEAQDLLGPPTQGGELRRLTILFCDLVDSTVLSTRTDPEAYRTVVRRYREDVLRIVDHYGGHISSTKGDGLLALFGHPRPHENDVRRAVQAGLEITREVARLSEQARRRFGVEVSVRVGVHRGLVYLDTTDDDVYGFAANLAARVSALAPPGGLVVSDAVAPLVRDTYELETLPAKAVKGVQGLVNHHQVLGERIVPTRNPLGPLVGRQHEVSCLRKAWSQAQAGTLKAPGVALLGEAGIGKSRLVATVAGFVEESGAPVVWLFGSPFHSNVGLHPIRTLIERSAGIGRLTEDTERLRLLEAELRRRSMDPASAIPLLAPVLGIPAKCGYQPVQVQGNKLYEQIATAVQQYLVAQGGDGPGLIVVEDLHWFDASTLDMVNRLLMSDLGRLLIVITGRDDTKLPDAAGVQVLDVQPLSDGEAEELIVALGPELSAAERDAVRSRCDGMPLYIEEVVTGRRQAPADESGQLQVPDRLYDSLFARLRTSRNTVPVVAAAATIGREVDRPLLLSVLDLDEVDIDDVIDELEDALVFEPTGTDAWRFRHELYREIAYELSPPRPRRALHGRVADALVGSSGNGAPEWRLVALHYEEAERFDEAAKAYQQASTEARQRGALDEARACLGQSIENIQRIQAGRERDWRETSLRLRRGFLTYAAEGPSSPNVAADFERCLELSSRDKIGLAFYSTMVALYGYYAMRADLDRLERLLDSLRAALAGAHESLRPSNEAAFGMLGWYRGEFADSRARLEHAATSHSPAPPELSAMWFMPNDATASIYTHLALARYIQGDLAGAEEELLRTERWCEQLPFPQGPFSLAYAHQMEVLIRIEAGQLERAGNVAINIGKLGEQHGFDAWVMVGATQQETVKALCALTENPGDVTAIRNHIASITGFVDQWRALDMRALITFYDAVIARLLIATGQTEDARRRLQIALDLADETGMHFYDAELIRLRAYTTDDIDSRRADLRSSIELAHRQDARIFELRSAVEYCKASGKLAGEMLADAISCFPDNSTWPELARARSLVE